MKEIVIERFGFRPAQYGVRIVQHTIEYGLGVAFGNDIVCQAPVIGALIFERERASFFRKSQYLKDSLAKLIERCDGPVRPPGYLLNAAPIARGLLMMLQDMKQRQRHNGAPRVFKDLFPAQEGAKVARRPAERIGNDTAYVGIRQHLTISCRVGFRQSCANAFQRVQRHVRLAIHIAHDKFSDARISGMLTPLPILFEEGPFVAGGDGVVLQEFQLLLSQAGGDQIAGIIARDQRRDRLGKADEVIGACRMFMTIDYRKVVNERQQAVESWAASM